MKTHLSKMIFPDGVYTVDVESERRAQAIRFGMSAASFAALLACTTMTPNGGFCGIALFCLSASLPLGLASAMISWNTLGLPATSKAVGRLVMVLGAISDFLLFAGVLLMLCEVSVCHGIFFGGLSLAAFLFWGFHTRWLGRIRRHSRIEPVPPESTE